MYILWNYRTYMGLSNESFRYFAFESLIIAVYYISVILTQLINFIQRKFILKALPMYKKRRVWKFMHKLHKLNVMV